ncbi:MAG: hypothetical protein K8F91_12225 [Candidatus Obscuribacterales bacterium]|nr:hypothetical protein [Candidatus Obscuribacterales bacterium]
MISRTILLQAIFLGAIVSLLAPLPAHAYLDLGAGSFMLQIILGMFFAVWISFKGFWARLGFKIPKRSVEIDSEALKDDSAADDTVNLSKS